MKMQPASVGIKKKPNPYKNRSASQAAKRTAKLPTSFIQRHKRFLSFVGALIVFATFIAKEGIGEGLKARLDAIDTAEAVYSIREDNTMIANSRITIEWRNIKENRNNRLSSPNSATDQIAAESDLADETDDALNSSFSNLFALDAAALAFDAHDIPDLTTEYITKDALKEDYNDLLTIELTDDNYFQNSPKDVHGIGEFTKFENDSEFNLTRNDLIGTNLIDLISKKRQRDERYLRIAGVLSYILYAFGWGLGLVDRMYGLEDSGVE